MAVEAEETRATTQPVVQQGRWPESKRPMGLSLMLPIAEMNAVANASTELSQKEHGKEKPQDERVTLDFYVYDSKNLDENGNPIVTEHVHKDVGREALGIEMKKLEGAIEEVRNNRQEVQTAYQGVDQKVNQLYQIMTGVSKTMNDERGAAIFWVEHVMEAIMGVADRVVVLHHGEKIAEGPPAAVTTDPRVLAAYLGEDAA